METSDKAYSINVYQYAWVPDAPDSLQNNVHKVIINDIIENGDEKFVKFTIKGLITGFPELGTMDGIIFFSTKSGFIGSYFLMPDQPEIILEKRGNILENLINYSDNQFRLIR